MIPKDIYILLELLGSDPKAESIRFALSRNAISAEVALTMLQSLVRKKGWNPDNLPKFGLPTDLPPTDYAVSTAVSGDVKGDDIGPSDEDLDSHIGIFGMTSVGKTTLVKLILVAFTKEEVNG